MDRDEDNDLELTVDEPTVRAEQSRLPIAPADVEFGKPLDQPRRKSPASSADARTTPANEDRVGDYRHEDVTRTNIPETGLATQDKVPIEPRTYSYDPHLDPQLVWAGKAEHTSFDVDTVSLHIHERVSTAAILRAVRREDVQRTLFSDPAFSVEQELDFYQHEMDWANRLILGDSLLVMNSLLHRENMAGKVQCIYIDPPYGVNYNSNFQPRTDQRDVRDDDKSLTREPEQIRAYRDTWQLGIHSYLTYLRDRLLLARDLLTDSGSVFVQISDDNAHYVRSLMEEVFGRNNFLGEISFAKTSGATTVTVPRIADYLIWYARDASQLKFHKLYVRTSPGAAGAIEYKRVELSDGSLVPISRFRSDDGGIHLPEGARVFATDSIVSKGGNDPDIDLEWEGKQYLLSCRPNRHWKAGVAGTRRLWDVGRLLRQSGLRIYKRYFEDFPYRELVSQWTDTRGEDDPSYVVQTDTKVIERCILMTTDPGDVVLDPTCGSGTSAHVAEQWGRRWITCDTSRVAMALARQRLMTASYDYYQLADASRGVDRGFNYKTVPHVTLESIARDEPPKTETLYDQPLPDTKRTRVAGPFTVEQIPSYGIDLDDPDAYDPGALAEDDRPDDIRHRGSSETNPVSSIGELVDLLRIDGVRLPGGRKLDFLNLAATADGGEIHADGEFEEAGEKRRIGVSFGPLHGPIGARQVEDVLREAVFAPYHAILFAGFAIDGAAQQFIQNYRTPKNLTLLMANIAADVLVPDLLKSRRGQQLFAVFGEPDVELKNVGAGELQVHVHGIDVYDPTTGEVTSDSTEGIAAWFLDQDYDRRSFLISQAFFPGARTADPWERLSRNLRGWVDPDAFEMLRGTTSLPFKPGPENRVAVKVIDFRGNEAIRILDLPTP